MKFSKYRAIKNSPSIPEPAAVVAVVESTVPEHLHAEVESWNHHSEVDDDTSHKMSLALGHGTHTHFPLDSGHVDMDADVAEHLTNHGWVVKDYKAGIASKKTLVGAPERGIPLREKHVEKSIGKVLEETNAHDDIKKAFTNDPARAVARSSAGRVGGHHVVISTSPMALAGMSTGTSWKNQSCMNMEGGCNAHYLKDDSAHGTHVAFLVPHDDHEAFSDGTPNKPLARIALKPYHAELPDGKRDTIFRPETKTYGAANTQFSHAVSMWASEKYPAVAGVSYHKERSVYDDSGNDRYTAHTKESIVKAIENGDRLDTAIDHHIINHAIDHVADQVHSAPESANAYKLLEMTEVPNLSSHHVAKMVNILGKSTNDSAKRSVMSRILRTHGDKVSSKVLNSAIEERGIENLPTKMYMNPKFSSEHVDNLPFGHLAYVRNSAIKPHHIDALVDGYTNYKANSADIRNNIHRFTKQNLDRMVSNFSAGNTAHSPFLHATLSQHFTKEHHDKIMGALGRNYRGTAFKDIPLQTKYIEASPHTTAEDIDTHFSGDPHHMSILLGSNHVRDSDMPAIKNSFIRSAKKSFGVIDGFREPIPHKLAKLITPEDRTHLMDKYVTFADPKDSEEHLNAVKDHIDSLYKKSPDDHTTISKALKGYSNAIYHHADAHGIDDDDGTIKDKRALAVARLHIGHFKTLPHYDEENHYEVSDTENNIRRAVERTARHRNTEDDLMAQLKA